jgi:hypothetical protein
MGVENSSFATFNQPVKRFSQSEAIQIPGIAFLGLIRKNGAAYEIFLTCSDGGGENHKDTKTQRRNKNSLCLCGLKIPQLQIHSYLPSR